MELIGLNKVNTCCWFPCVCMFIFVPIASLEEASNYNKIASSRAIDLLTNVAKVFESEPEKFQTFLDVLKEELEHVTSLLDRIQQDYGN